MPASTPFNNGWCSFVHSSPGTAAPRPRLITGMEDDEDFPKVDKRGTTILVPLGLAVVCAAMVALMMWPKGEDAPRQGPTGSGMARPGAVK
jgi:hypothetical protein